MSRRSQLVLHSLAGLLVGAALIALLIAWAGPEAVASTLRTGDLALLAAAFALTTSQTLTMALRWWAALRLLGHRASFVSILRANSLSNVVNFVAPGHFGEPLAATWLGRTNRAGGVEAFSVLVGCKAIGTLLNLALLLGCVPLLAGEVWRRSWGQVVGLTAAVCIIALLGLLLLANRRTATRVARALSWGFGLLRLPGLARGAAAGMDRFRATFALFTTHPAALAAVALASLVKIAALVGAIQLTYAAFGHPMAPLEALFIETMNTVGKLLSIWIPGNLGLEEAIHAGAAHGGLGVDEALATSASLATKAILTLHVAFGAVLAALLGAVDPPGAAEAAPAN